MIAALYVQTNGAYYGIPDVDPWDEERDARNYDGPYPVVAHPPCESWSIVASRWFASGHRTKGDDGGCFAHALETVRKYGGVLEHPAKSFAWDEYGLLKPSGGGWSTSLYDDGWVCEVDQGNYGHLAAKRTWLYAVGCQLPEFDWRENRAEFCMDTPKRYRTKKLLPKAHRPKTPEPFKQILLDMARSVKQQPNLRVVA